jgi:hypothetical protein
LLIHSAQALIFGCVVLISPDTFLDVFVFKSRERWQTPESLMLFRVFGIALLSIGVFTAVVANACFKHTHQKVAVCLLLWSVVGFMDCVVSHQLSERRFALGRIVEDPFIPATVHFMNISMVVIYCWEGLFGSKFMECGLGEEAQHEQTPNVEQDGNADTSSRQLPGIVAIATRGMCWCCGVLALALILKPTHSMLFDVLGVMNPAHDFSGYLEAEARVVAIWTGVCLAVLALAGLNVLT